jgi:hypothetical protein
VFNNLNFSENNQNKKEEEETIDFIYYLI